ncbi:MAG: hypothetical protein ACYDCK_09425 [Thermoplasmatota archaeon]
MVTISLAQSGRPQIGFVPEDWGYCPSACDFGCPIFVDCAPFFGLAITASAAWHGSWGTGFVADDALIHGEIGPFGNGTQIPVHIVAASEVSTQVSHCEMDGNLTDLRDDSGFLW